MKVLKYLTVGLFQFLLDLVLFLLLQKIGLPLFVANATSRLTAATTGCYLNRHFTFFSCASVGLLHGDIHRPPVLNSATALLDLHTSRVARWDSWQSKSLLPTGTSLAFCSTGVQRRCG